MESLRNTLILLDDIEGMDDIDDIMSEISNIRDSLDNICDSLECIVNDAEAVVKDLNKSFHINLDGLEKDLKSASASLY